MNKKDFGFFLKEIRTFWPNFGQWYMDPERTAARRQHFELVFQDLDLDVCQSAVKTWFRTEPALQPMDYDDFPVTMKAKHDAIRDRRDKNIRQVRRQNKKSFVGTSGPCMSAALSACANLDPSRHRQVISDILDEADAGQAGKVRETDARASTLDADGSGGGS